MYKTDASGTHFKVLNKRRGPAVWGHRAQIDRELYKKNMQEIILKTPFLKVEGHQVDDLVLIEENNNGTEKLRAVGVLLGY